MSVTTDRILNFVFNALSGLAVGALVLFPAIVVYAIANAGGKTTVAGWNTELLCTSSCSTT